MIWTWSSPGSLIIIMCSSAYISSFSLSQRPLFFIVLSFCLYCCFSFDRCPVGYSPQWSDYLDLLLSHCLHFLSQIIARVVGNIIWCLVPRKLHLVWHFCPSEFNSYQCHCLNVLIIVQVIFASVIVTSEWYHAAAKRTGKSQTALHFIE